MFFFLYPKTLLKIKLLLSFQLSVVETFADANIFFERWGLCIGSIIQILFSLHAVWTDYIITDK